MANLKDLHPTVREATEDLIEICKKKGINILIAQGFRSIQEQNDLYAKGRTAPGLKVTNAKGGTSYHNYGLAIDFCLLVNGKAVWEVNEDWRTVAAEAEKLGFEWGGKWKGFVDYPHLQMTFGYSIKDLQAGKVPPVKGKPAQKVIVTAPPKAPVKAAAKKKLPLPTGVLKKGDQNVRVGLLQKALTAAGYNVKYDNDFGPSTEAKLKAFQKDAKLKADGIYGPSTKAALNKKVN